MENQKVILVVEDNPLNMKLVIDLLELSSFKVIGAVNGESVFEVLGETIPELIILDIQLPGIDGFEVLKRIRENKKFDAVKIIALTAQVMKEEQENIKKAGFNGYIVKPFDIKDFVKTVKDIVVRGSA